MSNYKIDNCEVKNSNKSSNGSIKGCQKRDISFTYISGSNNTVKCNIDFKEQRIKKAYAAANKHLGN